MSDRVKCPRCKQKTKLDSNGRVKSHALATRGFNGQKVLGGGLPCPGAGTKVVAG